MILTVGERIRLLTILPDQGDLTTIRIVRQLRESLSFSEEEHAEYGITLDGGMIHWRTEADAAGKNIVIGPKATDVIRAKLAELDKAKKLTEAHLSLCDKFALGEDES
jgi:hypothetical protein